MLGEWLREARRNKGRTLPAVADAINATGRFDRLITKQVVSRLENGIGTVATYDAVADLLNLDFVTLPDGPTLAARVKAARVRLGLTHSEVSRRSGLSREAVSGVEANDATLASLERVLIVVAPTCRPLRPRAVFKRKTSDVVWTPPSLIAEIRTVLQRDIELDVAGEPGDFVGAQRRYTIEDDGLVQPWDAEVIFCNPPYSRASQWLKRGLDVHLANSEKILLFLVPARSQTEIWQRIAPYADILLLTGRLHFWGPNGKPLPYGAPHSSAIIIFGQATPDLIERARQVWKFIHIPKAKIHQNVDLTA